VFLGSRRTDGGKPTGPTQPPTVDPAWRLPARGACPDTGLLFLQPGDAVPLALAPRIKGRKGMQRLQKKTIQVSGRICEEQVAQSPVLGTGIGFIGSPEDGISGSEWPGGSVGLRCPTLRALASASQLALLSSIRWPRVWPRKQMWGVAAPCRPLRPGKSVATREVYPKSERFANQ
jgi:hypothetical protein